MPTPLETAIRAICGDCGNAIDPQPQPTLCDPCAERRENRRIARGLGTGGASGYTRCYGYNEHHYHTSEIEGHRSRTRIDGYRMHCPACNPTLPAATPPVVSDDDPMRQAVRRMREHYGLPDGPRFPTREEIEAHRAGQES